MADNITPEMARAELARRRQLAGAAPATAAEPMAASGITPEMARAELARRRASSSPSKEGSGLALNATAGANEGIYGVLGAPVDLTRGAMNLGIRGFNAVTGSEVGQIPEDSFGGSRWIGESMGALHPVLDPENTEAVTTEEKIARGVGQGAGYALAPEAALAAATRTGSVAPRIAETAGKLFGRGESVGAVSANAAIGGASGAGSVAVQEAAPEDYKQIAGMLGGTAAGTTAAMAASIPSVVRAGASMVGDYLAPMTEAGRTRLAAQRFRNEASDIGAVRETLDNMLSEIVPGSMPTTGQLTGDLGILGMERGAAVKNPELFAQRRADQNQARVSALGGIQQGGAPEKVVDAVRQRLRQIEDDADTAIQAAMTDARTRTEGVGVGMHPEEAGASLRASLEVARSAKKEQEQALWGAVDPGGNLRIQPASVRARVADIVKDMPASAKPPSGEEAAILEAVSRYGDVVPFSEVAALKTRLGDAMREERGANGETSAYRRMAQVNSALYQDIDGVISSRVRQEAHAVARGEMREQDTFAANFLRAQEEWLAGRNAGQAANAAGAVGGNSPVGFGANGPGGSRPVPGMVGATGQAGGRLPNPSRDPRLSSDAEPNFDAAARERLNAANAATRERVQTFDNPTLAPLRRRPATNAPYAVPDAAVAGRVFRPGTASFDAVSQFRRAVGDEQALPTLEAFAIDRLRKMALRDDGTLDPGRLQSFRRSHADALRAFPELDARIADAGRASEIMAEVATQQRRAVTDAQKGALSRFLQIDNPDDVTRTVGGIFSAQDATRRMGQLRQAIGSDPEAAKGLRQAVADHMARLVTSNTEAGTSGIGALKSDGFQNFVKRNVSALRTAGFNDDEVATLRRIGEDLQRANRSIAAVKNPGGSDTAQNVFAAAKGGNQPTILTRILSNVPMAVGGVGGFTLGGGPISAIAGAVGAKTVADMRQAGINTVDDFLTDALLNPARAKALLLAPSEKTLAPTVQTIGQMYRRAAAVSLAASGDGGNTKGGPVPMMPGATMPKRRPLEITIGRSAP